jgi:TrmH family RNA methyltransferase
MSRTETPLTSPVNPRLRAAAALRERRTRERTGRILIDGAREVLRAVEAGVTLETIFVCPELCRSAACRELLGRLGPDDPRLVAVAERAFGRIAFGDRAEGVVAVAARPDLALTSLRLPDDPLVVVVEGIEKPGNLGAILRSADGAGADALVAADPRTDLFNPNAVRASLGTIFTVGLAAASSAATLDWLRRRRIRGVAARVDAATLYTDIDLRGPLAIVLGAEATGLTAAWDAAEVTPVRLPMLGAADSLNVAAAAAVLLYEARRQRGPARSGRSGGVPENERRRRPVDQPSKTT